MSPRGDVVSDERTNSLIVKDVPDKVVEVRDLVTKLDIPAKQVMIDSRIVIASDDFARDIGVRFGVSGVGTSGNTVSTVSGGLNGTNSMLTGKKPDESGSNVTGTPGDDVGVVGNLINTGQPYPAIIPALNDRLGVNLPVAGPSIAMAILGSNYLVDLELSALQTEGKGEILSNPRVVTADLKKATIIQGRQIPYSVVSDQGITTLFKDALLRLDVIPQITPDDRVRMDLKIAKDDQGPNVPQATGGFVPSIEKREVETQVLVNNGETVVLGGVFEQSKTKSQDKVPLLGDVPLLGYLFQRNGNKTQKRELLIFVTPQILKNGAVAER
ncbi:MAG: type IV pilus secretin PilQ [Candidatus Competibacteraceae bacterium]